MSEFVNQNLLAPDQRTEGWYKDRAGKFTGSRFVDVLSRHKTTGEKTEAYHRLLKQICLERLTNDYLDTGMDSFALKWGREVEPYARQAYQFETGDIVEQTGFVNHKTLSFVGVSPDGRVKPNGGTEFKCPKDPVIHLDRFNFGMKADEFMPQVQGCIWVCEADWWDWVSYDPRFPEYMRFYRERIYRDDAYIKNLETTILIAEAEVRTMLQRYSAEAISQILDDRSNPERKLAA